MEEGSSGFHFLTLVGCSNHKNGSTVRACSSGFVFVFSSVLSYKLRQKIMPAVFCLFTSPVSFFPVYM